jgi:hypothetical protein
MALSVFQRNKYGIDIGVANGEFTLFFLKCTNASMVFAFEP